MKVLTVLSLVEEKEKANKTPVKDLADLIVASVLPL